MRPPLVGIPSYGSEGDPDDASLPSFRMTQTYIQRLEAAGATPFIIPLLQREATLHAIYETLGGLLLAGASGVGEGQPRSGSRRADIAALGLRG